MSNTPSVENAQPRYAPIIFFAGQYQQISRLPDDQQLKMIHAICRYEMYGEMPDFGDDVALSVIFGVMQPSLETIH